MNRAPFQVLVLPYTVLPDGEVLYAIFRREPSTGAYWQGIAGGGEDGESPLEAARREAYEEAGIEASCDYIKLDTLTMIPVVNVSGFLWGEDVLVIPEYCFGVLTRYEALQLSDEHTECQWFRYEKARLRLRWDSNRNALWELNHRVTSRLKNES
ncbi:MAG: NUDIX hydrolase [Pyrinomonadaceae bacterium]